MDERRADGAIQQTGTGMKRRGILRAAGTAVGVALAGIVARQTSQPVAAAYTLQGDTSNTANATTSIGPLTFLTNTPVLQVQNGYTTGFTATADAIQAAAIDNNASGVRSLHYDQGDAIYGHSPHGVGVRGHSSGGYGVIGNPGTGIGVYGDTVGANQPAIYGVGYGNGGTGVTGYAVGVNGNGVRGDSASGTGVVGNGINGVNGSTATVGGYGGYFTTTASSSTAVGGQIFGNTSGAAAFVGAAAAGNFAAFFTGQVSINGSLFVSGGAKSAAVKHPRTNDYRALYCVESPDSWFEDAGAGKLVNGKADIKLDPDFAALIHTDDYHVFLTPYGSLGALRVVTRRGDGFAVEEIGGSGSGTFSYRVMSKRSDIKLDRLAKVAMPSIKLASEPPQVPDAPAAPPSRPAVPPAAASPGSTASPTTQPPAVQPIPQPRP